jgi:transcriptional regulator with XRE-family HTH domain
MTLVELAAASGADDGNLSRIERGARKPPKLPRLLTILEALQIRENSPEWHELLAAAARDRFESLDYQGITYLGEESPLHGLPPEQAAHGFTLAQAALEIGRISASHGVKKITVEAGDGSERFFAIREGEGKPSQG